MVAFVFDLIWNFLGYKTTTFVQILKAIPAGVTSLNLRGNCLCDNTGTELIAIAKAIPDGLTSLNLSCNSLDNKTGAELIAILTAIPAGITALDLSWNLKEEQITALFKLFEKIFMTLGGGKSKIELFKCHTLD